MKKIFGLIMIAGVFAGCGKENQYSTDFAAVAFVNAAPATPAAGFSVFVDTIVQTGNLGYRSSSGYISVTPGARNVDLRGSVNFQTVKYVEMPAMNFTANTASTVFVYDTLSASNQKFKTLRLNDDLTLAANGSVKVRFVPLAVNAVPMDVTFLRTSVTPNDSVTLTNRAYVGAAPNEAAIQTLSSFTTIPLGSYTVKLKPTGTETVAASANLTLNGTTGYTGIYTIYSTGTAQGLPLAISSVNHYR